MNTKIEQFPAINPNPVLSVAKDGTLLYSNEAGKPLLNEWCVEVGEKLPPSIVDFVQRVISRNSPEKMEVKLGKRVYLVMFHPLPEEECVNMYGFDISELKELEGKLRDSENKYRNIVETSVEGIWIFNSVSETTYVNEKMAEIMGYNREEMVGRFIWDFAYEEDKGISQVKLANTKQGIDDVYELKLLRKDGSLIWVSVSSKGFLDDAGKFAGSVGMFTDITDRKRTERTLLESEEKYRIVADNTFDWEFWLNPDGRFVYTSPSCERVTGYSAQEFMDNPDLLQKIIHSDDRQPFLQHKHDTSPSRHGDIEFRIVTKDGEIIWIHHLCQPIYDGEGRYAGSRGSNRDITEHKRAEEILAFERLQFLSIFDGMDDVVYVTDPYTYEVLYANKAMKEKFGGELVEGTCYREFQRKDSPCDFCTNPIILKERDKPYFWEYYNPMVDRFFMIMDRIIKWPDGRDVRLEIAKDITERKQMEDILKKAHDGLEAKVKERTTELEKAYNLLKESEGRLAEAQKIAHVGCYDWNIATNEEYWSDELYRIFGLDPQFELNHNTFLNCIHPEDLEYVSQAINEALNGKPYNIDYRIILPDGEEHVIYSQGGVIFDEKNTPIRMRGIVQDITDRKKAEESLVSIEIARKREIHHRIKNNLQVISSLLDLQAEKFRNRQNIKDSEVLEAFRESQDRVISMALIHEELHKGEGFEKLNFSLYIEELAENLLLTYRLGNSNINLNTDLSENILFDVDIAIPLGIIINELVSNSLKYAFPEKNDGEIRVKLHREEGSDTSFILIVSDNGVGISEDLDIEDLDSLGLQLVTSLVDQLEGELELKRGNGTEFIIRFTVTEESKQVSTPQLIE